MNYFKYIFSDKKGLLYWIFAMVFMIIYLSVSILANYQNRQPNWILLTDFTSLVIVALIFIGFYTISFINVKFQNKFFDTYSVSIIN
jgi:multisubunit Na+/H+ antiporter MnhB subunit